MGAEQGHPCVSRHPPDRSSEPEGWNRRTGMWRQGRLDKGCCFLVLLPDRGLGACGKCCGCRGENGGYTMVTSPFESSGLKRKVGGFNHQTSSAPRMLPLGCQPQCAQGMGKRQPWAWSLPSQSPLVAQHQCHSLGSRNTLGFALTASHHRES